MTCTCIEKPAAALSSSIAFATLALGAVAVGPAHGQVEPTAPNAATTAAATAAPVAARAGGAPQPGGRYAIDPTHTFVLYEVGHYGTSTNRGRLATSEGQIRMDTGGAEGRIEVTIDMATVNTGVDLLNRHVQSIDFLNVAEHPIARFAADKVRFEDGKPTTVGGQLTMLGRTHPVALQAVRFNCYIGPLHNRQVCGGDFQADILRSQWGMTWGLQFGFEDRIRLLVQVEAVLVSAPQPR